MNKDLESSIATNVAGTFSNPDAAEKEIPSTPGQKSMEEKTTQNSDRFKGMCMKNIL